MASFGFEGGPLRPIAWAGLIALELGLTVGVALGSDPAAYAAAALMLLFAAITASALLRGYAGAPCACFGPDSKVSWLAVLRRLAFAAVNIQVPQRDSVALSTDGWLAVLGGAALAACGRM